MERIFQQELRECHQFLLRRPVQYYDLQTKPKKNTRKLISPHEISMLYSLSVKLASVLASPVFFGYMTVKLIRSIVYLFFKISFPTTIPMESSRRDLFIDMLFDRFILMNTQITHFPNFTSIPKSSIMGLP